MTGGLSGEPVIVEHREVSGLNGGAESYAASLEEVANVLVQPGISGSSNAGDEQARYTLHFPKAFQGRLGGKRVAVRGRWCLIQGDPDRYAPGLTPGEWDMPVVVVAQSERSNSVVIEQLDAQTDHWVGWLNLQASVAWDDSGRDYAAGARRSLVGAIFTFDYDARLTAVKYEQQRYRILCEGHAFGITSYNDANDHHLEVVLEGEFNG